MAIRISGTRKPPPTVAVFWFEGKAWRGKDTSDLPPGQPTKASRIEFGFSPSPYQDMIIEEMNSEKDKVSLDPPSVVYLRVNGETIFRGPATVKRLFDPRRPYVPHYVIMPTPPHLAMTLTLSNEQEVE